MMVVGRVTTIHWSWTTAWKNVIELKFKFSEKATKIDKIFSVDLTFTRGWVKKKYKNGFKSGGNIVGQSAS